MSTSQNASPNPAATVLQMLSGKWVSQGISTAAQLNIADHLANGPLTISELAILSGTNARALLGLMRALESVGLFAESEGLRFANTPLSEPLRASVPGSARALALFLGDRPTWNAWGELPYTIRTGQSAFKHANGELPYEFFSKNAEQGAYFNEAFTSFSAQEMEAIHRVFDFSKIGTLVDVGGGHGAMLCSTLGRNPGQKGILFDQPHVIDGAAPVVASFGVSDRCELVGGSFFETAPSGADGYIIKHVLFNWDDERALAILKTVRRAMPRGARLFVIDPVIQPGTGQTFAKFMDLEMMVLYDGGCQRTQTEFTALLDAAALKVVRVVDTDAPSSIIEAVPV